MVEHGAECNAADAADKKRSFCLLRALEWQAYTAGMPATADERQYDR